MLKNIDIMRDIHAMKSHSILSVCSDSSLTICYLEKRQKLTRDDLEARRWLPSPHCPELSRTKHTWIFQEQATPEAEPSPSLPFSVHLSASQGGQSFPLLNTADAQGGPQGNNASMSLQRTSTRKVSGTRSTGDLYVKRWRTRAKECATNPSND